MTEKKPITLAGVPIRMGKLKKKLARAKRSGDSELQMEIQQNIDQLVAEKEQLEKFQAANPPGPEKPAAAAAPAPAVSAGLSSEEAKLAVNMIVGVENTILSAVAGRTFKMEITEDDQKSMEEALSLTAAKRLSAEQKGKMDLAFLAMAFLAPLLAALPKALAAKKMVKAEAAAVDVEKKIDNPAVVARASVSIPSDSVIDIAGPMPPKAN